VTTTWGRNIEFFELFFGSYLAGRRAEKMARLRRHREEQQAYRDEIAALGDQSVGLFESLPKLLISAEESLDKAEGDFADHAFAPFWDCIENAATRLGHFDESVHHIKNNSARYVELLGKYEDVPPQFPLARQSVAKLSVAMATANRMKAIVRTAQRDFQFATIYEQRKTNQILVAGFTNLAQALDRMTTQISTSIEELAGSVDVMTSTLNESIQSMHSRIGEIGEHSSLHHVELMKESSQAAAREKKALEMLDNIQRGRRPSL
jgi:hypothetical protein